MFEKCLVSGDFDRAKKMLMPDNPNLTFSNVARYGHVAVTGDDGSFQECVTKFVINEDHCIKDIVLLMCESVKQSSVNTCHLVVVTKREDINAIVAVVDSIARAYKINAHIHLTWETFNDLSFKHLILFSTMIVVSATDVIQNNTRIADIVLRQTSNANIIVHFGSIDNIVEGQYNVVLGTRQREPYILRIHAFDNIYDVINPSFESHDKSLYQQIDVAFQDASNGIPSVVHVVLNGKVYKNAIIELFKTIQKDIPLFIGLQGMNNSRTCCQSF